MLEVLLLHILSKISEYLQLKFLHIAALCAVKTKQKHLNSTHTRQQLLRARQDLNAKHKKPST